MALLGRTIETPRDLYLHKLGACNVPPKCMNALPLAPCQSVYIETC